jgi:alpha-beta hydrolase superfamily lysophospholipase
MFVMKVKGGRLDFLAPHLLRGQLLRPGFVSLSLRMGFAQQMPAWAKLQFTNAGVSSEDLDRVLGRISGLTSWADEWESLGRAHEQGGRDALELGRPDDAARRYLAASAAYNFAQYVVFLEVGRKRALHEACVRAYARAAPLFRPPAIPFEVPYRRHTMNGFLRIPPGRRPAPVVVIFHGTNAVKEELHWWSEALLERGVATIVFDGPGMGSTFHRMSMVAEPRPVGVAIMNHIETRPELDPRAVAFLGMSLGGYLVIRMASHERRIRAVAAVSPPYSADIYWNVTLASMRRELASLYGITEAEMGASVDKITLADVLSDLKCPLMLAGGGHDLITPGSEAWRIFEGARCERELVFYPRGAHDCFNVLADLRPRMTGWLARQLERHNVAARRAPPMPVGDRAGWGPANAVDEQFADELSGEGQRLEWNRVAAGALPARWRWWWRTPHSDRVEVVERSAPADRIEVRGVARRN